MKNNINGYRLQKYSHPTNSRIIIWHLIHASQDEDGSVFVYVKVSFLSLSCTCNLQNPKEYFTIISFQAKQKVKDPPNCHEPSTSTTFSSVWSTELSSTSFLLLLSFFWFAAHSKATIILYGTPILIVPSYIYKIKNLCGILLCVVHVAAWFYNL